MGKVPWGTKILNRGGRGERRGEELRTLNIQRPTSNVEPLRGLFFLDPGSEAGMTRSGWPENCDLGGSGIIFLELNKICVEFSIRSL
jgi:hypothetical protein